MSAFVLILFIATSHSYQSGAGAVSVEFSTYKSCLEAGESLSKNAHQKGNNVLPWGCFKK